MTIRQMVDDVNDDLRAVLAGFAGVKIYGIAEPVTRITGTEQEVFPGVVAASGEISYVGPDDVAPMIVYHKFRSLSTRAGVPPREKAYGRDEFLLINTYALSLVLYYDWTRIKIDADALYLSTMASISGRRPTGDFKEITCQFTGINLNSREVFDREFKSISFRLPPEKKMIELLYSIEGKISKNCLETFCCK